MLIGRQFCLQGTADSLYYERQQLRLELQASVEQMLMQLHSAAALHARAQHRMLRGTDTSGEASPHAMAEQVPLLRQLTGRVYLCGLQCCSFVCWPSNVPAKHYCVRMRSQCAEALPGAVSARHVAMNVEDIVTVLLISIFMNEQGTCRACLCIP